MKTIVLIVGPSGSGKTNLIERLFETNQVLRSVTTRPMRPDEVNGVNYHFVTDDEFDTYEENHELTQRAEYAGHRYGMTKMEINDRLTNYDTAVMAVIYPTVKDYQSYCDVAGIRCIPVFCTIDKAQLLAHFENRLESEDLKQSRIKKYEAEMANQVYFDEDHILDMNPNDYGESAGYQLTRLMNRGM